MKMNMDLLATSVMRVVIIMKRKLQAIAVHLDSLPPFGPDPLSSSLFPHQDRNIGV
jgi:hypothetical protein